MTARQVELRDKVAEAICDDEDRRLTRSLLATDELEEIVNLVVEFVGRELGDAIEAMEFCELSVAAVFGLRLGDGRRVVVKAFRPDADAELIESVASVQRHLAATGFPCPAVIGPPRVFGRGHAIVMPTIDEGDYVDATQATVRAEWAGLLWRQLDACGALAALPGFPGWRPPSGRLWNEPHNVLFDFDRTRKGAEWIDAIAADALDALESQATPLLLGHADWSAKHFRYCARRPPGQRITAVYDWDSLRRGTEAELVAGAAMSFSVTWYVPGRGQLPSVEDALAFVSDYESARSVPFSPPERRAVVAAARYACAYTARCEHSVDPDERNRVERSARAMLREVVDGFRP